MRLLLGLVFRFLLFINPKGGWRFECQKKASHHFGNAALGHFGSLSNTDLADLQNYL